MSLAKMECENSAVFDLETLQDIGDNIEILVIPHQAGIAVDGHQTDVFGARHQHLQTAAVESGFHFSAIEADDERIDRQSLGDGGERAASNRPIQTGRLAVDIDVGEGYRTR